MDKGAIVPSPRYCRPGPGTVSKAALGSLVLPRGASKALDAALERMLGEAVGRKLKVSRGGARLAFTIALKGRGKKPARPPQAPRAPARAEGYAVQIQPEGIAAAAHDPPGLFYAAETVAGLLRDAESVGSVLVVDWPLAPRRGLHLDLKGFMPTFEALLRAVDEVAALKMNMLLVEYEDKLAYESHPALAAASALSKDEVRRFVRYARERFVEVVPLLQGLGHVEYIVRRPEYAALAELPDRPQQFCPMKPGSLRVFMDCAGELAALHPSGLLHAGLDEAWQLGRCPRCAVRSRKDGKDALYIEHLSKVAAVVRSLGKRPIIWDDMLRKMPDALLADIPRDCELMYWIYGMPAGSTLAEKLPQLGRYRAMGFDVLGAAASKGADGPWSDLPNYEKRMDNLDLWGEAVGTGETSGLVATAWSRYNSFASQCDVPDSQHLALAYAAERAWSGRGRSRAEFEALYGGWTYGLWGRSSAIAAAHHAMNRPGRFGSAWALELSMAEARRGRERLRLVAALGRLEDHLAQSERLTSQLERRMPQITGNLPRGAFAELGEQIERLAVEGRMLALALRKLLARSLSAGEVEEFVESRLGATARLAERARELLR